MATQRSRLELELPPGAHVTDTGTMFVVYAPSTEDARVRFFDQKRNARSTIPLGRRESGIHAAFVDGVREGALYKLVLDGEEVPDPFARFMPYGVDGPARVMAPRRVAALSPPLAPHSWTIHELHVGTFTPEGTYAAAMKRLDDLVDLGVGDRAHAGGRLPRRARLGLRRRRLVCALCAVR